MFVRVDPAADEVIPAPAPPAPPVQSVRPAAAAAISDEPPPSDAARGGKAGPHDQVPLTSWPPDPVPLDAWPAETGAGAEDAGPPASGPGAVAPAVTLAARVTAAGPSRSAEPSRAGAAPRQRLDVPPADVRPAAMHFDPLPAHPAARSSSSPVLTELPTDWDAPDWSPGRAARPAPPPPAARRAAINPKTAAALVVLLALAIALPWFLLRDHIAVTGVPPAAVEAPAAGLATVMPPASPPPAAEPKVLPPAQQEAPPAASAEDRETDDPAPTERPVPAPSTTPPPEPEPPAPVPAPSAAPPPQREPPAAARNLRAEVRPPEPSGSRPSTPAPPPQAKAAAAAARRGLQRSAASTAPAAAPPVTAAPFEGAPVVVEDTPPLKLPPPEAEPIRPAPAPAPARAPATAAAAPAAPTDEQLVSATLQRYAMAYQQLDAGAARQVWPDVDQRALARAFETLESQQVTFERCRVRVQGRTATADCAGSVTYVPKVGRKDPRTVERRWDFALQKGPGAWHITRAMAR